MVIAEFRSPGTSGTIGATVTAEALATPAPKAASKAALKAAFEEIPIVDASDLRCRTG
jgi:hypothetical protein